MRKSSNSKIISPAAFSRKGSQILDYGGRVTITDLTMTAQQKKRVLQRQQQNPNFCPPTPETDQNSSSNLNLETIPWYLMTTEQLIEHEKMILDGERTSKGSENDDLSTISSTSSIKSGNKSSASMKFKSSVRSSSINENKDQLSRKSSIHSSSSSVSLSSSPATSKNKSLQEKTKKYSPLPSSTITSKKKSKQQQQPLSPADMNKNLSQKFLRVNDLNLQINETEEEIKRLHHKQKNDQRRIQTILRDNNRAMEEIAGTQEELSLIYDVALQLLENTEAGKEAQKARLRQSAAEQEAYRKSSLERELESLRIAHKHYKVNYKTVTRADMTLSRYERIEYLWGRLREYCWEIGHEKVLEKRKIEEAMRVEQQRAIELTIETQNMEGRRRSLRAAAAAAATTGGGIVEERRKSIPSEMKDR